MNLGRPPFIIALIWLTTAFLFLACQTAPPLQTSTEAEVPFVDSTPLTADQVLALADTEPQRALELFLAIDPDTLDRVGQASYRRLEKRFKLIKLERQQLGLAHNNIGAMAIDGDDLWVGDWLGGVSRYSLATHDLLVIREGEASTNIKRVNNFLIEERYLWIVASDAIIMFDKKNGTTTFIPKPLETLYPAAMIRYQGKLILATHNGGLWQLNGDYFAPSPLNRPMVKTVNRLLVVDDNLYAATPQGLWLYNQDWQEVPSFKGLQILSLAHTNDALWVGTNHQLYYYRLGIAAAPILAMSFVKNILVVEEQIFVASDEEGLAHLDTATRNTLNASYHQLSPALLRIGSLAYSSPYLIVGTLGNGVMMIHQSLLYKRRP